MRMKRRMIGALLLTLAIVVGFYVAGWLCLLDPVLDIIEAVKMEVTKKDVVLLCCKIIIFLPIAAFSTVLLAVTGHAMVLDK